MILQSLVRYYELLAADPDIDIVRPGYCSAKVSYVANLSPEGELLGLISCKISQQRGKKMAEVPQPMLVPEQVKKSVNIAPNFLCENAGYCFGLDTKGNPERTKKCFQAFCGLHRQILQGLEAPEAAAILRFIDGWDPRRAQENPRLAPYMDDLMGGALLIFGLNGGGRYAHQAPEIREAWERYRENGQDAVLEQCLVCGEKRPVARLHPAIKGVRNAQSIGASIVSFNAPAYESYGKEKAQGLNAPVSEYAAFAYGTALNFLLSRRDGQITIGDATAVYWAESTNPLYSVFFSHLMNPAGEGENAAKNEPKARRDAGAERQLAALLDKITRGLPVPKTAEFDPHVHFCILGLSPNVARLSVRFFMRDSFGNFLKAIGTHYRDLMLTHAPFEPDYIPLWKLLSETAAPFSRDKASSPLLSGAVFRAVLLGSAYPEALYSSVLLRVRADHSINYFKAAILKACLLRKKNMEIDKEVLTVALNEDANDRPYVLGRLFAVLESIQRTANPGINATIKDRYFNSACATPAGIFPILLKLKNNHMRRIGEGLNIYYEKLVGKLMDKIGMEGAPFPVRLTLEQQGVFNLGYYHQVQENYKKKVREEDKDGGNRQQI